MGRISNFLRIVFLCAVVFSLNTGCNNKKVETKKDTTQQKEDQTIDVFGIINATNIENINIDFPAKVEKLYVKEGQKVKFGESLVGLSIKDYESQIKSKELELDNANYELRSGVLDYQKLQDDLKHAETEVNKAQKDFDTQKTMFESGSVAKKEMDDAESILNSKNKILSDIKINLEKYSEKNNSIQNQKNKISHIQNDLA
jgi:HlyD family secretion protein